jgi:hypothetical protein
MVLVESRSLSTIPKLGDNEASKLESVEDRVIGPKSGPKKLVYTGGGGIKEGFKAITSLGGFEAATA